MLRNLCRPQDQARPPLSRKSEDRRTAAQAILVKRNNRPSHGHVMSRAPDKGWQGSTPSLFFNTNIFFEKARERASDWAISEYPLLSSEHLARGQVPSLGPGTQFRKATHARKSLFASKKLAFVLRVCNVTRSQQSTQGHLQRILHFCCRCLLHSVHTVQPSIHPSASPLARRQPHREIPKKNPKSDDQTWHVRSVKRPPLTAASLLRTKVTRPMPCKRTSKTEGDKTTTRQPSPILPACPSPPAITSHIPSRASSKCPSDNTQTKRLPSTNTSTSTSQPRKARRLREQQRPSRPDCGSYFLGGKTRPGRAPAWHQHQHQRQHQGEHCSSSSPVQSGGRGRGRGQAR